MNGLDPSFFGLLLIGIITGLLAAILGIGGGLLMVPTLTYWGATPLQAVATSLVGIVLASASGTYQNWRMKQLNLTQVLLLAPPAMLMTEVGVWIANALPPKALLISFAALQVIAIYLISLKRKLRPAQSTKTSIEQRIYQSEGIGLLAGVLSGLFGVGGGIVMVPLQMLFLGETIKEAVRTSLGAILLISSWAIARHAASGNVLWLAGICLGSGALCGAQIGARLLFKLPEKLVTLLFRGLLLLMAGYMISKAFA
ncbi:sulfite exporter TauE/SafE family protein [Coleofasciculus sp. LEGE 07092]|nr:sulfite exporter TauE/SafE family protein [Coleofasciculus sp. LEGE 07081]MBE9149629.1 sulfite exporter TauE/SafE family protein [Coleofasciculus sp. LEGE 07092]